MPNFTTQITDANVIAELPDVSILAGLYADDLTQEDLITSMNSVSFRKKFQALLGFKLSDTSKASMYDALKAGYIQFETDNGRTVTESNGNVFVDDRLVAFTVDGFADGLFEDESFANLFFTEEVIDVIFGSGDESFIKALTAISNFWDKLLVNATLTAHFEDTYADLLSELTKTVEVAYVKYVAYKASLEVQKYKTIEYLAEDSPAMDAIYLTPEARSIESDSTFGVTSRLMYVFNTTDIDSIANSDENIAAIETDVALRNIVVDIDTVLSLPVGSKMREFVVNNDGYFGAIVAERLEIETTISLSNIFYDETFAEERAQFVQDQDLVTLLFESDLYENFEQQFYTAFTDQNVSAQKFSFKVNEVANTLTAHYTNASFEAKKLELSLDSFTETKAGSVSTVSTEERIFFAPYTFIDASLLGVQIDHGIEFTNGDNYNLYNELLGDTFNTVIGSAGHILAIATDGRVVSSKFVVDLNLSTETVQNVTVTENNAFIKTAESFHAIGNFGADRDDIINTLVTNKDTLSKAVYFNGTVLALGTDNKVKIVDASGISDFSAASDIEVEDIMVIAGDFVVLATDGTLSEIKADNTIVSIATNVGSVVYSQDAIVCTVSGAERAIFSNSGTWLTYDFNVNTL
jgi:hypothetical protein